MLFWNMNINPDRSSIALNAYTVAGANVSDVAGGEEDVHMVQLQPYEKQISTSELTAVDRPVLCVTHALYA